MRAPRPAGNDRPDADRRLEVTALLVDQQHDRAGQQRQDDRQLYQVIEPARHCSGSRPSTWSVPVSPREASSTTRNKAVVAKLITMAVRTRD